jgi:hypothetical protein
MNVWRPIDSFPRDGRDVLLLWWYWYPGDKRVTRGVKVASWYHPANLIIVQEDDEMYDPAHGHMMWAEIPEIPEDLAA